MQSYRRDISKTREESLNEIVGRDQILYSFPVVPLDYGIQDHTTPILYVTSDRMIFSYDDSYEVYMLNESELNIFGDQPNFAMLGQVFEPRYRYTRDDVESFQAMKLSDQLTRFSINEPGQMMKEFVLRDGPFVSRTYQTWAMSQLIINRKYGAEHDEALNLMLVGSFAIFNKQTVISFTGVFLIYFLAKLVTLSLDADIIDSVMDGFFIVVLIAISYWAYLSLQKNLSRHRDCYIGYVRAENS